jgi:transcriptional regulator with XRE-family HTH domain
MWPTPAVVRGRRGAAIAARKRALTEWEQANPGTVYDPEWFAREVLPGLAGVKLSEIVEATGMSKAYASDVRRGKWTPHVSTWPALAEVVGHRVGNLDRTSSGH